MSKNIHNEGKQAFQNNLSINDCPYNDSQYTHDEWLNGFREAVDNYITNFINEEFKEPVKKEPVKKESIVFTENSGLVLDEQEIKEVVRE